MTADSYKISIADYVTSREDTSMLRVAFETKNAYPTICKKIAENFLIKIKERLQKENRISEIELGGGSGYRFDKGYSRITLHIRSNKWKHNYWIGFKDHDNDRFYSFVSIDKEEIKKELYPKVKLKLGGNVNPGQWWKRMKSPFNRWDEEIDGLVEMHKTTGETIDYFINEIYCLYDIVEEYIIEMDKKHLL